MVLLVVLLLVPCPLTPVLVVLDWVLVSVLVPVPSLLLLTVVSVTFSFLAEAVTGFLLAGLLLLFPTLVTCSLTTLASDLLALSFWFLSGNFGLLPPWE